MKSLMILICVAGADVALAEKQQPERCFVYIKNTLRSGETTDRILKFKTKTKGECEKMRRLASENFAPHSVARVAARMKWVAR